MHVLTQSSIWSGVILTPMPQLSSKAATLTGKTGWDFIYSTAAKRKKKRKHTIKTTCNV